jgi:hypothetical protein
VQIPFVWLFGVFYSFAWSGLLVAYALEVLPFKLRAKGLMIMNITVQAILAVGKYVVRDHASRNPMADIPLNSQTNPVAWKNLPHHWNFTMFYTLWITVELVFIYFVYVETRGPTLEYVLAFLQHTPGSGQSTNVQFTGKSPRSLTAKAQSLTSIFTKSRRKCAAVISRLRRSTLPRSSKRCAAKRCNESAWLIIGGEHNPFV